MANGTLAASQLEMLSQSGNGITTIVPPATNTNRTLTLPDSTGTLSTINGMIVDLVQGRIDPIVGGEGDVLLYPIQP